jgi:hypothetical protein
MSEYMEHLLGMCFGTTNQQEARRTPMNHSSSMYWNKRNKENAFETHCEEAKKESKVKFLLLPPLINAYYRKEYYPHEFKTP